MRPKFARILLLAALRSPWRPLSVRRRQQAPRASLPDIEDEVMCTICGTLLEVSDSPQAEQRAGLIRRLIARGKTKTEIKERPRGPVRPGCAGHPRRHGFDLTRGSCRAWAWQPSPRFSVWPTGAASADPLPREGPTTARSHPQTRPASIVTSPRTSSNSGTAWGHGLHSLRCRDPEQAERPRDRALGDQAKAEPRLLHPLSLRPDHLTVAVESVEVSRHLHPVRT